MTFSVEPQTLPYSCENVPLKWCTDCWWLCTGAVNADPNYLGVGQVRAGAVIVAYNSGYPAAIHRWWTSGYRYILTYCIHTLRFKGIAVESSTSSKATFSRKFDNESI